MIRINSLSLLILLFCSCTTIGVHTYCEEIPDHKKSATVMIFSEPAEAMIYVNGKKAGTTPLQVEVSVDENIAVIFTAKPLFKNHYRQQVVYKGVDIPQKLTFYMTQKSDEIEEKHEKNPSTKENQGN